MKCPECEEGQIISTHFKANDRVIYMCEFCGCYWVKGEKIDMKSEHPNSSLFGHDREYTVANNEMNNDSRSIMYPKFK